MPTTRRRQLIASLVWTGILVAATAALLVVRTRLDKAHISLVLLLVVLLGTAAAGRALGLWLATLSFLAFNWFFLPPYGTLVVRDPRDWLVLVAFLLTSVVAAQLLARAREETAAAEERAAEVDRLATLGAETLNVGRAEDALAAIADVIRSTTGVARCEVFARDDDGGFEVLGAAGDDTVHRAPPSDAGSLVAWVGGTGTAAIERTDGTFRRLDRARPDAPTVRELGEGEARALLLPLRARDRIVGVLRIATPAGLRLDPERWRFVDAISYYAALGVERVRLVADAAHAEALREADQLKDSLLASVSHDLRTPLTTIKALANDLGGLGDERAHIIEQEADRLNRLVAGLLDLSRLNAGALSLRVELNAIDDLLGATLQQVERALGHREIVVSLPPGEALLLGRFDIAQSLRILVNLVENADKYAPGSAPIEIRAARAGETVAISVADRGPGVPASQAERIFEPFYRPPGSPPDVGGAGLGLSIARRLAEAQGGSLSYAARPGGGSVFTLRLPAADLDTAAARASAPS